MKISLNNFWSFVKFFSIFQRVPDQNLKLSATTFSVNPEINPAFKFVNNLQLIIIMTNFWSLLNFSTSFNDVGWSTFKVIRNNSNCQSWTPLIPHSKNINESLAVFMSSSQGLQRTCQHSAGATKRSIKFQRQFCLLYIVVTSSKTNLPASSTGNYSKEY